MAIKAEEYEDLRAWLAIVIEQTMPFFATLPADTHPIIVLDKMAAASPARARQGLAMAISDILEDSARLPPEEVERVNFQFANAGLPSLAAMRVRFQKRVKNVLKRAVIKNEVEYYALRNAVEGASTEADRQRI